MFPGGGALLDAMENILYKQAHVGGLRGSCPSCLFANMFLGIYYNLSICTTSNRTSAGAYIRFIGWV